MRRCHGTNVRRCLGTNVDVRDERARVTPVTDYLKCNFLEKTDKTIIISKLEAHIVGTLKC